MIVNNGANILNGCTHLVPPAYIDQSHSLTGGQKTTTEQAALLGHHLQHDTMSFTAPVVPPPAPPEWARLRQQTVVFYEVSFFMASDEVQTIRDFWTTFISAWGCGIEYGREINTEIGGPRWHVHGGFHCNDYSAHLNSEDPRSTSIKANEDGRFSYILRHKIVSKSVGTYSYLQDHAALLISQGVTIRLMGVSTNTRYPHLAGLPSRYRSWWYELNEDQDEDYSTLEDLLQWRQAATIPNAISGNNANGSSHYP